MLVAPPSTAPQLLVPLGHRGLTPASAAASETVKSGFHQRGPAVDSRPRPGLRQPRARGSCCEVDPSSPDEKGGPVPRRGAEHATAAGLGDIGVGQEGLLAGALRPTEGEWPGGDCAPP